MKKSVGTRFKAFLRSFYLDTRDFLRSGKIYSGLLYVLRFFIMVMVILVMTSGVVGPLQGLLINLAAHTNFGEAPPQPVDLMLMVGIPGLFIAGMIFVLFLVFYRWLWARLSRRFDKFRRANYERLAKKYGRKVVDGTQEDL